MPSAVVACCARSCAGDLPAVLANIEAIAATYDRVAIVIVENDSVDQTKTVLQAWIRNRRDAYLIELDGLEQRHSKRTERLAICRNAYIEFIRNSEHCDYDHLVILDGDDINGRPIDPSAFERARDWLEAEKTATAVFANTFPIYYDIWALRHPTWCPGDCLAEVRGHAEALTEPVAQKRFRDDRQIPIDPGSPPIEVQSAFGGLGLYRLRDALSGEYVGIAPDGRQTCEHVAFNLSVAGASGRRLFILPWLQNGSLRKVGLRFPPPRKIKLFQGERSCSLRAPHDHEVDALRKAHPLYGRRFPLLSRMVGERAPGSIMVDVGAGIGDTEASCRLEGCELPIIAVEGSLSCYKYLLANCMHDPGLLHDVDPVWTMVGPHRDGGTLEPDLQSFESAPSASVGLILASRRAETEDVSILKTDTGGNDHLIIGDELDDLRRRAPIIWAGTNTRSRKDADVWAHILDAGADDWPFMIVFDSTGFAYCAGTTREKATSCMDLMSYARRHRDAPTGEFERAPTAHPHIALFPLRFADVFDAYCRSLPDLSPSNDLAWPTNPAPLIKGADGPK